MDHAEIARQLKLAAREPMRAAFLDAAHQEVFRAIEAKNQIGNRSAPRIYSLENAKPERIVPNLSSLQRIVGELQNGHLVVVLPAYELNPATGEMILNRYCIPSANAGERVALILDELIEYSCASIDQWSTLHAADLLAKAELQLNDLVGLELQLPSAPRFSDGPAVLSYVWTLFSQQIIERLQKQHRAVALDDGALLLSPERLWPRLFELARHRIVELQSGKTSDIFELQLQEIALQEELYYSDVDAMPTGRFLAARGEMFSNAPGLSAIERLLLRFPSMHQFALDRILESQWKKQLSDQVQEIRGAMFTASGHWRDSLRFFNEEMLREMGARVWRSLSTASDVLLHHWEAPQATVQILCPRTKPILRNIAISLTREPPAEAWKVMAFRGLVESEPRLFEDILIEPEMRRAYNDLLAGAYRGLMSFWERFLAWTRISFLAEAAFAAVKKRVEAEQTALHAERRAARDQPTRSSGAVETVRIETRLEREIDRHYFDLDYIPSVEDIARAVSASIAETLSALQRRRYVLVPVSELDSSPGAQIVLFPRDARFPDRLDRVKRRLPRIDERCNLLEDDRRERLGARLLAMRRYIASRKGFVLVDAAAASPA